MYHIVLLTQLRANAAISLESCLSNLSTSATFHVQMTTTALLPEPTLSDVMDSPASRHQHLMMVQMFTEYNYR